MNSVHGRWQSILDDNPLYTGYSNISFSLSYDLTGSFFLERVGANIAYLGRVLNMKTVFFVFFL